MMPHGLCPDCGTFLIDEEVNMGLCLGCDYIRGRRFELMVDDG